MNKRSTVRVIALFFLLTLSAFAQHKQPAADQVIQKTINKLNSLKTISYNLRAERNYASERYYNELNATSYLDFRSPDKFLGVKFQFDSGTSSAIYNGSEIFSLSHKDHTIRLNNKPGRNDFEYSSYLGNSPASLRTMLPRVLNDKTIPRAVSGTTIEGREFYVIEYVLEKFYMDVFGDFAQTPLNRKITYNITVSKDEFMPVEVLQRNGEVDFIKTNFTNINQKPAPPAENSWYYSTYLGEYKFAEPAKDNLIKAGTAAPEITLPVFGKKATATLSDYKGKLVLLEFWIYHCGGCIASVPELNAIHEKYKDRDFKLLAVNIYDSPDLIDHFIKNKKPVYEVLHNGESAAKQYGVDGYPTVVLIGRDGKVVYSGRFDPEKVAGMIENNL